MLSVPTLFLYAAGFVIFMVIADWLYEIHSRGPVVAAWMAYYEGFTDGEIKRVRRSDVFYANRSHVVPTVMDVKIGEKQRTPFIVGAMWLSLGGEPIYQEYRLVPETAHVIWKVTCDTPPKS